MLSIAGVLNVIYGIAAVGDSKFFVNNTHYAIGNLNTWGWVALVLGMLQLAAAVSLFRGGLWGRIFGAETEGFSAIAALLSIPAYPFWSLAIFAIDILVIYGLASYGDFE